MNKPGLSIVQVSRRNRSKLLQRARRESQHLTEDTQRLLAQLHSFHRSTAEKFVIRNTHEPDVPFRLLVEDSVADRKSSSRTFNSFIALSYCWHSNQWARAQCLGQFPSPWPISRRLFDALLGERISPNEGIWIDALCIDQDNAEEKQRAIAYMDMIYRSARRVVVVLEDITFSESEKAVLDEIFSEQSQRYVDRADSFRNLKRCQQQHAVAARFRIWSARWFKRAWCSHELQVGIDFTFLIPTESEISTMTVDMILDLDLITMHPERPRGMPEFDACETILRRVVDGIHEKPPEPLLCQFQDLMQFDCSIESDRISIAVNAVKLQLSYQGGELSKEQGHWVLAMIALASGEATVLSSVGRPLILNHEKDKFARNSWLSLKSHSRDLMGPYGGAVLRQPPCIRAIEPEYILLDLLSFPTSCLRKPIAFSHERAEGFVAKYLELCQETNTDICHSLSNGMALQESTVEILACFVDCGIGWLLQQPTHTAMYHRIQSQFRYHKFDLWQIIYDMFLATHRQCIKLSECDKDKIWGHVLFVLATGNRFATGSSFYNSRLFRDIPINVSHCWILELGEIEKAIIFAGNDTINQMFYKSAMPVALSGSSCAMMRRLWILRQVKGNPDTWTIYDKLCLFTWRPIQEDGTDIVRLKDQKIVGGLKARRGTMRQLSPANKPNRHYQSGANRRETFSLAVAMEKGSDSIVTAKLKSIASIPLAWSIWQDLSGIENTKKG